MILTLFETSSLLTYVISREEILNHDSESLLNWLQSFYENPKTAKRFMENVSLSFDGYNQNIQELFEIPEVRDFVHEIDKSFPYWLFFLTKDTSTLKCITLCFLLPYLKDNYNNGINKQKLEDLLLKRWIPAMNHIGMFAGLNEKQLEKLTDRSLKYIMQ